MKMRQSRKNDLTRGVPVPGLSLAAVMSFLKETKGLLTWTSLDLASTLNISEAEASSVLAILKLQDYIRATPVVGEWITSPAGESVSGATTPRFLLQGVNNALTKLSGRMRAFNKDSSALFRIKQAVAFGDFLREPSRVQAADVGLECVAKKLTERSTKKTVSDILKELRNGSLVLNLHSYQPWMSQRTHRTL
jgi:hypothetical protein